MYLLVLSLADPVSRTFLDLIEPAPHVASIGDVEVKKYKDVPVLIHKDEPTAFYQENVAAAFGKYAVFISRHEMSNPKPIYTVHTPGAWPDVSVANPCLASTLYRLLCRYVEEPYQCAYEATHHPPNTSYVSSTFLEVGSGEVEWKNRRAVSLLLQAFEEATSSDKCLGTPTMVVGDIHYVTVGDLVLRGEVDLGHVIPKYVEITLDIVETAYRKHVVTVEKAIIFRKNVKNPTRGEIIEWLKNAGVDVVLKG